METNEAKRDATDNRIWDLGHLYFNVDMVVDEGETEVMMKEIENPTLGQRGKFIQIKVKVDTGSGTGNTPIRPTISEGVARPGTAGGGEDSNRIRDRDDDVSMGGEDLDNDGREKKKAAFGDPTDNSTTSGMGDN